MLVIYLIVDTIYIIHNATCSCIIKSRNKSKESEEITRSILGNKVMIQSQAMREKMMQVSRNRKICILRNHSVSYSRSGTRKTHLESEMSGEVVHIYIIYKCTNISRKFKLVVDQQLYYLARNHKRYARSNVKSFYLQQEKTYT